MTHSRATHGLRALDPDLPFLAAEVALDVENLLAGLGSDRAAMTRLAEILLVSVKLDSTSISCSRMDMATLNILGAAVAKTSDASSLREVEDLFQRAERIAEILLNGDPNRDSKAFEQAQSFCEALSCAAAAYTESIRELRSPHPFRR